jgi:hypothetical protein
MKPRTKLDTLSGCASVAFVHDNVFITIGGLARSGALLARRFYRLSIRKARSTGSNTSSGTGRCR